MIASLAVERFTRRVGEVVPNGFAPAINIDGTLNLERGCREAKVSAKQVIQYCQGVLPVAKPQ